MPASYGAAACGRRRSSSCCRPPCLLFLNAGLLEEIDFMLWREDRPMRIALLGCGTVGGGVYEFVQERTDMEIAYVLSRRPRPDLNCPVTSDFSRIVSDPTVDTVIEVMGGRQPAYE